MGANGFGSADEQRAALEKARRRRREADEAAVEYWNLRVERGGALKPSPTIAQAINGGYRFLRVRCSGCEQAAYVSLEAIRRDDKVPIWQLEDSLSCQRCRAGSARAAAKLERLTREDRETGYSELTLVQPSEDPFGEQTADDPQEAFARGLFMAELWSKDGQRVERMFYAGNRLPKATAAFEAAVKHRPHRRYTVRQGIRVLRKWPDE